MKRGITKINMNGWMQKQRVGEGAMIQERTSKAGGRWMYELDRKERDGKMDYEEK